MSIEDQDIDQQIEHYENKLADAGYSMERTEPKEGGLTEETMRAEMSDSYDRAEAKAEGDKEAQIMPSAKVDDDRPLGRAPTIDETVRKTYEWLESSQARKDELRGAADLVATVRENAAKFGVTLTDADAMKAAMELEQQGKTAPSIPQELQPAMQSVKQLYPDRAPHEIVNRYAEIDSYMRRAPAEAAGRIFKEATGQHPLELARSIAASHSPQHVQQFYRERDANVYAEAFLAAFPDVDQDALINALGKITITGDHGKDLRTAFEMIGEKPSRPGKRRQRSMESRMREAYEARQR